MSEGTNLTSTVPISSSHSTLTSPATRSVSITDSTNMISTKPKDTSFPSPSIPSVSRSDTSSISKRLDMSKLMFSSDLLYESSLQIKNPIALNLYSSNLSQPSPVGSHHEQQQPQQPQQSPSKRRTKGMPNFSGSGSSFTPASASKSRSFHGKVSAMGYSYGAFQTPTKAPRSVSADGFAVPFSRPSMSSMATPMAKIVTSTASLSSLSSVSALSAPSLTSTSVTPTKNKMASSTTGQIFTPFKSIGPSKFLGPISSLSSSSSPSSSVPFTPPRSINRRSFKTLHHLNSAYRSKFSTPVASRVGTSAPGLSLLRTPHSVSPASDYRYGFNNNIDTSYGTNLMTPLLSSASPSLSSSSIAVDTSLVASSSSSSSIISPSSVSKANFAFISHSPETYRHQRPPTIDNAQLARRKRRRTSPTELSTLETEFIRCQKPSRDLREDIARRVGMTEKAVQIWFQNKRQAVRRGSLQVSDAKDSYPKDIRDGDKDDHDNQEDIESDHDDNHDNNHNNDNTIKNNRIGPSKNNQSTIASDSLIFDSIADNAVSDTRHTSSDLSSSEAEGSIASVASMRPVKIFEDNKADQDSLLPSLVAAKKSLSEGSSTDVDEEELAATSKDSNGSEDEANKENRPIVSDSDLSKPLSSSDDSSRQVGPSKLRLCMKDGQAQIMVAGVLNGCNRTFPLKAANMKPSRNNRRSVPYSQQQLQHKIQSPSVPVVASDNQTTSSSKPAWPAPRYFRTQSPFDSTPNAMSGTPGMKAGYYLSVNPKTPHQISALGVRNLGISSPTKRVPRGALANSRRSVYDNPISSSSKASCNPTSPENVAGKKGMLETEVTKSVPSDTTSPATATATATATVSTISSSPVSSSFFGDIEKTKILANVSRARFRFNMNRAVRQPPEAVKEVINEDKKDSKKDSKNQNTSHVAAGLKDNSPDANSMLKTTSSLTLEDIQLLADKPLSASSAAKSTSVSAPSSSDSPSASSRTDKEYECISNLLSLRSGAWC